MIFRHSTFCQIIFINTEQKMFHKTNLGKNVVLNISLAGDRPRFRFSSQMEPTLPPNILGKYVSKSGMSQKLLDFWPYRKSFLPNKILKDANGANLHRIFWEWLTGALRKFLSISELWCPQFKGITVTSFPNSSIPSPTNIPVCAKYIWCKDAAVNEKTPLLTVCITCMW